MMIFPKRLSHYTLCCTLTLSLTLTTFGEAPHTFTTAKRTAGFIFSEYRTTLYCGCKYDVKKRIDLSSCGMQAARAIKRAHRVEWEHMMPAENFGRQLPCWREKICQRKNGTRYRGRLCCERIDHSFKQMESELYNLWPADGEVNRARSNYRFNEINPNTDFYGCSITIDKKLRHVEPSDQAKGIVARANLFMADHYHINLSKSQRKLFNRWNHEQPPTRVEVEWASKVASIEGYTNPYITETLQ